MPTPHQAPSSRPARPRNYVYKLRAKPTPAGAVAPRKRGRKRGPTSTIETRAERALAKLAGKGVTPRAGRETAVTAASPVAVASSGPERELAALIVQVGTVRAEEILTRVKDVLSRMSF